MLGQKILCRGIELDKVEVEIIKKLPPLALVKAIRSFFGSCRILMKIYKRFFKNYEAFSKIA